MWSESGGKWFVYIINWSSDVHQGPHFKQMSSKVSSQDHLLRIKWNVSLYSLNSWQNTSSHVPKFDNFSSQDPFSEAKPACGPTLWKSGSNTHTWKQVEYPPLERRIIILYICEGCEIFLKQRPYTWQYLWAFAYYNCHHRTPFIWDGVWIGITKITKCVTDTW